MFLIRKGGMHLKKRRIAVFLLSAFFASTYVTAASAAEISRAEAISEEEELTVSVVLTGEEEYTSSVLISLYQVADVTWDGGAVIYSPLIGDAEYAGMTAEESSDTAGELAETDLSGLAAVSGMTDADGEAYFTLPEPGMYLVVQDTVNNGYAFAPFLVPVPQAVEEDGVYVWNYQVVCEPKAAVMSTSTYAETSGGSSTNEDADGGAGTQTVYIGNSDSVKTGDAAGLMRRIVLFAAAAAGAVGTAAVRIRRRRQSHKGARTRALCVRD